MTIPLGLSILGKHSCFQFPEAATEAFNSKTVSRIVGVSLRQIQYWDEQGFIRPSLKLSDGRGSKRLYSFSDLVQLKLVKNLTDHGLSLKKIRRCVDHLRRRFPEKVRPSGSLRYVTDGERLFVITDDRNKILDVMERQFVLSVKLGPLVRELNSEVRRFKGQPGKWSRAVSSQRIVEGRKAGSA